MQLLSTWWTYCSEACRELDAKSKLEETKTELKAEWILDLLTRDIIQNSKYAFVCPGFLNGLFGIFFVYLSACFDAALHAFVNLSLQPEILHTATEECWGELG